MKWVLKRDSTGWPWLESDPPGYTIAKYVVMGTAQYVLWKLGSPMATRVRVVEPAEVEQARKGWWEPTDAESGAS